MDPDSDYDQDVTIATVDDDSDDGDGGPITLIPEQITVFDDVETIRANLSQDEIDSYLSSLVKAMIIVTPETYPMDKIFHSMMQMLRIRRSEWANNLYDLMIRSHIRRETIDLNGNIISWSEEEVRSWFYRLIETWQCDVNRECASTEGVSVIQFERWKYGRWEDVNNDDGTGGECFNRVIIEEYEDRYIERYPRWEQYTPISFPDCISYKIADMETRTIWKRDLWREELHTIPFKPIHLELMYSPALIGRLENEATKAKVHFESLC